MTNHHEPPQPACAGNPTPYDILMDHTNGPAFRAAHQAASELCGSCPLRPACHTEHADEWWVQALARPARQAAKPERGVAKCGTDAGYYRHKRKNKEDACPACKEAHKHAERRRKSRATGFDEAAVLRRIEGDRTIRLNRADQTEVVRRLYARGHSPSAIQALTGLKADRYLTVAQWLAETDTNQESAA